MRAVQTFRTKGTEAGKTVMQEPPEELAVYRERPTQFTISPTRSPSSEWEQPCTGPATARCWTTNWRSLSSSGGQELRRLALDRLPGRTRRSADTRGRGRRQRRDARQGRRPGGAVLVRGDSHASQTRLFMQARCSDPARLATAAGWRSGASSRAATRWNSSSTASARCATRCCVRPEPRRFYGRTRWLDA